MCTGLDGFSPSVGAWLMLSTTSMPLVTRPNAENLPSRFGPSATSMKKLVVALFGSLGRAIDTIPRTCLMRLGSSGSLCVILFANSIPHFSLVDRLPPWMTKPLTMRLKVVVSSAPVAARLRKLRAFSGAEIRQHLNYDIAGLALQRDALLGHLLNRRAVEWFGPGCDQFGRSGVFLWRVGLCLSAFRFLSARESNEYQRTEQREYQIRRGNFHRTLAGFSNQSGRRQPLTAIDYQNLAVNKSRCV